MQYRIPAWILGMLLSSEKKNLSEMNWPCTELTVQDDFLGKGTIMGLM